jgi:signal transduction histidine kinase/ActR/RegA family two-component response regulator
MKPTDSSESADREPRTASLAPDRPLALFQVASRARLADPRTEIARLETEIEDQARAFAAERAAGEHARASLRGALREAEARTQALLAEQMRMSQRGSALLDATRRLAEQTDVDAIYGAALEIAETQLSDAAVFVTLCDAAAGTFSVRALGTRARRLAGVLEGEAAGASFGAEIVGAGCAASVLPDSRYRFDAVLLDAGVGAMTAVPVASPDRRLPVIVAAWNDARQRPREDLWFLEHLAGQLTLALRSAALYADLRHSILVRQDAEEQVRRAGRLRELGDVAAGVAHAFNNSLTSVLGLADWLLLALPDGADGRQEITGIREGATEMGSLVRRLHDFSRIGVTSDLPGLLDVGDLASEVAELARRRVDEQARRRGVVLDLVTDLVPVPAVRGVRSQLRQAWLHLVDNAIESMEISGQLTLRSRATDGWVRVSVTDEGPGMTIEVRARAFEPFFSTKDASHTGIGLTVARAIAERHGGSLEIVSRLENGTTAAVALPAATRADGTRVEETALVDLPPVLPWSAPGPAEPHALARASSRGAAPRVLVVDDDRDVLDAVCELLSALGYAAEAAESGEDALALLSGGDWDVLLTDQGMPGMSGREVARRTALLAPSVPVVLLTGWAGALDEPPSDGIAATLAKPVTLHALREALDRVRAGAAAASPTA